MSLGNQAAVVGVAETDYREDYERVRNGEVPTDSYGYAATAFRRALDDAGIERDSIDGLIVGPTTSYERTAEVLGVDPRWTDQQNAGMAVINAALAIETGRAETVALVYGYNQRSSETQYGGSNASGGNKYLAYSYYAPWGMTSQGALYAMMTRKYMHEYGLTERQLGHVAVSQRKHARLNSKAIMQEPLGIEDYLDARYIVEPLRLYDYCLINDGGVALILTSSQRAETLSGPPVYISGIGHKDLNIEATQLTPRIVDFYRNAHDAVSEQVYSMADIGPEDIDGVQIYDSFSPHVIYALEGFRFADYGKAADWIAGGAIEPGGELPVNTSGGHLSESYMQGWNHQVEAIRQLRHETGDRQIEEAENVLYVCDAVGKTHAIVYSNGGGN